MKLIKTEAIDAVCPFFEKFDRRHISCEGLIEGAGARQVFLDSYTQNVYFTRFCASHSYKSCEHAKALAEKYKKRGDF